MGLSSAHLFLLTDSNDLHQRIICHRFFFTCMCMTRFLGVSHILLLTTIPFAYLFLLTYYTLMTLTATPSQNHRIYCFFFIIMFMKRSFITITHFIKNNEFPCSPHSMHSYSDFDFGCHNTTVSDSLFMWSMYLFKNRIAIVVFPANTTRCLGPARFALCSGSLVLN